MTKREYAEVLMDSMLKASDAACKWQKLAGRAVMDGNTFEAITYSDNAREAHLLVKDLQDEILEMMSDDVAREIEVVDYSGFPRLCRMN